MSRVRHCLVAMVLLFAAAHTQAIGTRMFHNRARAVSGEAPIYSTIAITSPVAYQTFQRNGSNQANIPITVTVVGPSGAIEASFNGGAWADVVASPIAGSNTGTLQNQPAGQGVLRVRFKSTPGIVATQPLIGVGDVFAVAGQSNAVGQGVNNQTYSNPYGLKATLFGNDYTWKELADPYDSNSGQVDTISSDPALGSWVPLLATQLMTYSGVPVAFIPSANNSTSVAHWLPSANHLDRSTRFGSLRYRIEQVGGAKAVLWWQGETDAINAVTQVVHNSRLDTFANAIGTDLSIPVIMARLQNSSGISDVSEAAINAAINEAIGDNANVKAGPDLTDIGSDDAYHLTSDAHLLTAADRWKTAIVAAVALEGPAAYWISPTGAAAWASCLSATPLSGAAACAMTAGNLDNAVAGDRVFFRGGAYTYNTAATLFAPAASGTASARITYAAYADEVPIITNINAGTGFYIADINGRDYITMRGLIFLEFPRHILIRNGADYNEIAYSSTGRTTASSVAMVPRGIQITSNTTASTHNWIHHNTIFGLYLAPCGEGGDGIMVGDTGSNFDSNYNTVEYNTIYNVGHAATDNFSQYNVYRGNFAHNEGFKTFTANLTGTATGGSTTTLVDTAANFTMLGVTTGTFLWLHDLSDPGSGSAKRALVTSISTTTNPSDTLNFSAGTGTPTFANGHSYSIGCSYFADPNPPGDGKYGHRAFHLDTKSGQRIEAYADSLLFEGNRSGHASSNPGNDGADGLSLSAGRVIVRYNEFFGAAGPGIYFKNGIVSSYNRVYNNTLFGNGRFLGTQFPSNPITTYAVQVTSTATYNVLKNNILYSNGSGNFSGTIPASWTVSDNHLQADGNPLFDNGDLTDYDSTTLPDLDLQAGSAALNTGVALTTTVGAGVGSLQLVVADALYFQDGTWGSALADLQGDWIAVGAVGDVAQIRSINYATNTITLTQPLSWSNGASVWLKKRSDGSNVLVGVAPDKGAREKP